VYKGSNTLIVLFLCIVNNTDEYSELHAMLCYYHICLKIMLFCGSPVEVAEVLQKHSFSGLSIFAGVVALQFGWVQYAATCQLVGGVCSASSLQQVE
jgi:hypothetical protein